MLANLFTLAALAAVIVQVTAWAPNDPYWSTCTTCGWVGASSPACTPGNVISIQFADNSYLDSTPSHAATTSTAASQWIVRSSRNITLGDGIVAFQNQATGQYLSKCITCPGATASFTPLSVSANVAGTDYNAQNLFQCGALSAVAPFIYAGSLGSYIVPAANGVVGVTYNASITDLTIALKSIIVVQSATGESS